MMTPQAFFEADIFRWEDGLSNDPARTHSLDPDDSGNWTGGAVGVGNLVGSQHGVTPLVLAHWRKVPVATITKIVMRNLSRAEAASIGIGMFYNDPGLFRLPWDPIIASVVDFGWGHGPVGAKHELQALIGVAQDGEIGPFTIAAYNKFKAAHGLEETARQWAAARNACYGRICAAITTDQKYLVGWSARSNSFLPGTSWWAAFNA